MNSKTPATPGNVLFLKNDSTLGNVLFIHSESEFLMLRCCIPFTPLIYLLCVAYKHNCTDDTNSIFFLLLSGFNNSSIHKFFESTLIIVMLPPIISPSFESKNIEFQFGK